jgi:hypothetical protein
MADPESQQGSRPQAAPAPHGGATGAPPQRALGRGLEDLSHLFLPRRPEDGPVAGPGPRPKADAGQPSATDRAGLMLLRPAGRITRSQVIAVIQEPRDAIEEHLHAIDASVPCSPCGVIDVLAIDAASRLVVIDVDTFAADGLLLRGLGHMEWLVRNAGNVRRMYPGKTIDFAAPPRLVLVAPRFSAAVKHAVSQIAEPEIACVRYHGVDVSGWTGVFFEPVTDDGC